jgi:hypothetical protein
MKKKKSNVGLIGWEKDKKGTKRFNFGLRGGMFG